MSEVMALDYFDEQLQGMDARLGPMDAATDGQPYSRSDLGLAERVSAYHGSRIAFNSDAASWLIWNGKVWEPDPNKVELKKLFADVARKVHAEVAALPESMGGARMDFYRFALSCEASARIEHSISLLPTCGAIARRNRDFDRDAHLMNVANGIVDLRTGELLPHNCNALCTKISDVEYRRGAQDDLFDRFITATTDGDTDFMMYLQRAAGYSLTAYTGEKCLFLIYSEQTDTAKSTFLNALKTAAGGYAITVDADLLLDRNQNQQSYDVAKLQGARVVSAAESKDGRRWNSGLVKNLTGGDPIRAREIRQSSVEFLPKFKLWLATNHAPTIENGGDDAMWNRLRRMPFNHRIPKAERDPAIKAALENPSSPTAQAFLRWAVEGARMWFKHGLGTCSVIDDELEAYQRETDPLGAFLDDCCVMNEFAHVKTSELREAYDGWCREQGQRFPLSRTNFARALRKHGCVDGKIGGMRVWLGVEL